MHLYIIYIVIYYLLFIIVASGRKRSADTYSV